MPSGVRAGLVSADVLRRERQELRRQERNTKHLEGRGVKTRRENRLAFSCSAFGWLLVRWRALALGCRGRSIPAEQPLAVPMDSLGRGTEPLRLIKGGFRAMPVKSRGGREVFPPPAPARVPGSRPAFRELRVRAWLCGQQLKARAAVLPGCGRQALSEARTSERKKKRCKESQLATELSGDGEMFRNA